MSYVSELWLKGRFAEVGRVAHPLSLMFLNQSTLWVPTLAPFARVGEEDVDESRVGPFFSRLPARESKIDIVFIFLNFLIRACGQALCQQNQTIAESMRFLDSGGLSFAATMMHPASPLPHLVADSKS